jgi:hypothetical protein
MVQFLLLLQLMVSCHKYVNIFYWPKQAYRNVLLIFFFIYFCASQIGIEKIVVFMNTADAADNGMIELVSSTIS